MSGAVWFYWPVTVAVVAAMNVRHLTIAVVALLAGAATGLTRR